MRPKIRGSCPTYTGKRLVCITCLGIAVQTVFLGCTDSEDETKNAEKNSGVNSEGKTTGQDEEELLSDAGDHSETIFNGDLERAVDADSATPSVIVETDSAPPDPDLEGGANEQTDATVGNQLESSVADASDSSIEESETSPGITLETITTTLDACIFYVETVAACAGNRSLHVFSVPRARKYCETLLGLEGVTIGVQDFVRCLAKISPDVQASGGCDIEKMVVIFPGYPPLPQYMRGTGLPVTECFFKGTLDNNVPCSSDAQCRSGKCETISELEPKTPCGICAVVESEPIPEGGVCSSKTPCEEGTSCMLFGVPVSLCTKYDTACQMGVCTRIGEAPSPEICEIDANCETGFRCGEDGITDCVSLPTTMDVYPPLYQAPGEACESTADSNDGTCYLGDCRSDDNTCPLPLEDGTSCSLDDTAHPCDYLSFCRRGVCEPYPLTCSRLF